MDEQLIDQLFAYAERNDDEAARLTAAAAVEIERLTRRLHSSLHYEKTAGRREAIARERQERAEAHRLAALPALADQLAGVVFDVIERDRVVVRAHLAKALHARLLGSGLLTRDLRFPAR